MRTPCARTLLAAWTLAASPPALAAPADDLSAARNAYIYGDYERAVAKLRPLLYPAPTLEREEDVVEARRLLGLSYLFGKDEDAARREFEALLTLRPDAELDPLVDPPPFVDFFDRIKREMRDKLDEARRRREAEEETRRSELEDLRRKVADLESTVTVVETRERSRLVALLPFGAGQFQNGEKRKGMAFLLSELALGTTSVSLALAVRLKWPDGTFTREERDLADSLVSAQVITGALFLGVALWGIVDANLRFVPRAEGAPQKRPRERLRLGGGPGGLWLGGRF